MDKEKDILTNILRNRLKDYEMPVEKTNAVWFSIEKDLMKPKANVGVQWRRIIWLSGAAVIAIFFCLKLILNGTDNNGVTSPTMPAIISKNHDFYNENTAPEEQRSLTSKENTPSRVPMKSIPVPVDTCEEKPPRISEEKNNRELLVDESKVKQENSNHSPKQDNSTYKAQKNDPYLYTHFKKKKNQKDNLSFALVMGNSGVFSSPNTKTATNYIVAADKIPCYETGMLFESQDNVINEIVMDTKYSIPFSTGFSVRKYFADFWALESGLTYTYLSSTTTLKEEHSNLPETLFNDKKTELHYLGIPLKIVGSFYNSDRISLYMTTGGMGEFCIFGKEYTKNKSTLLDIPEIQWSVFAGVGINYKLINRLGLFIEPEITYYFDDRNEVKTIRKSIPLNVNLQAGLRLEY